MPESKTNTSGKDQPHWWRSAAIVVVIAAVAWFSVRNRSQDPAKSVMLGDVVNSGAAKGMNVLLITLDTTKPEHLGCYGYELAHTPAIDSLAAHGVRFDDAITSVPLTLPSHATILTGLYPPSCGVRDNGIHALAEEHTTLAERFKAIGYDTAAFVACFVLAEKFGLAQGFDTYDFEIGEDGRLGSDSLMNERRADAVSTSAIRWLDARNKSTTDAPLFMWVHYYDPHHPYDSPIIELEKFDGRIYDAEIGFADMHIQRLLDAFAKHGVLDNTLVVFSTDHGEAFYEHEEAYHGVFLYETTMPTGFIISSPKLFDRPYRVDGRVVGTVDIVPTVIDLMGMNPAERIDGQSLLDPIDEDRAIYIETLFPADNGCRPQYGLRRHGDKFIDAPIPEYYDLVDDPNEERNLYVASDKRVMELAERLGQVRSQWVGSEDTPIKAMSPADRERMKALGYLGGGTHDNLDDLPDCKEQISVVNRMSKVTYLKEQKQYEEGIALATEVMHESEGWYAPVKNIVEMYVATDRAHEAVQLLRRFTKQYGSPESLLHQGQLELYELRDPEASLQTLEVAEIKDPKFGAVYVTRGDAYRFLERMDEAAEQYRIALEVDRERAGPDALKKLKALESMDAGPSD